MNESTNPCSCQHFTRRWFLQQCGVGLGAIALEPLLGECGSSRSGRAADPLAPKQPHHTPRAKHVIFLFQAGAPQPPGAVRLQAGTGEVRRQAAAGRTARRLSRRVHQSELDAAGAEVQVRQTRAIAARNCRNCCRTWPTVVDDIAIVRSLVDRRVQSRARPDHDEHRLAAVRPAEHRRLDDLRPGQRIARSAGLRRAQLGQEGHQRRRQQLGLRLSAHRVPGRAVSQPGRSGAVSLEPAGHRRAERNATRSTRLAELNRDAARRRSAIRKSPRGSTRFEMAYRMQTSAPELMDISQEPQETLEMYGAEPGKPSFANNCLLARRLVERGVRFVQLFHEAWDQHGGLDAGSEGANRADRQAVGGAGQRSQAARPARRHAGDLGRRVRPHADGARAATTAATIIPTPSPCGWPAAASSPASRSARPTTSASTSRGRPRPRPRPARHDPAPAGLRPHAAHLPLPGPRLPPDRRARRGGARNCWLRQARRALVAAVFATSRFAT